MQFPLASSPTDGSSSSASTSGTPSKPTKDEPPTRRPSRLDRQMERINKMLASTSIEKSPQPLVAPRQSGPYMGPMPRYPTREFERNTKKSQLGEFLSSLQDDNLGSAYGKQTWYFFCQWKIFMYDCVLLFCNCYKNALYVGRGEGVYWIQSDLCVLFVYGCNSCLRSQHQLTHWGQDKIAVILQSIFSNPFSWMKMRKFWFKFHWSVFSWVLLIITQHWFG